MKNIPDLYKKYFADKQDERIELFRIIKKEFRIKKGMYPGSFAHITPSFVIPEMVYVDSDKRCKKFFENESTMTFVKALKEYDSFPTFRFYQSDFKDTLGEQDAYFDLIISLYSGFVSQYCQRYLKKDGILLTNNSHGDAALAHLDDTFDFIGVMKRKGERFTFIKSSLDSYFKTKSGKVIEKAAIEKSMRGPAYTNTAYAYLFKKV